MRFTCSEHGKRKGGIACENVKNKLAEMSEISKKKMKCQHTRGNVYETRKENFFENDQCQIGSVTGNI